MYLKAIRAQGFKSFADKIDLEINPGITGIVGPNGSGKSNIVDAVRWVLGEQSVKSLRGQNSMSDVIFSGSSSREALKRAYVALTFDNTDHYLNSDYQELEIKRIVYATGENEYYINNNRVRLKDITNLFIDCGAGANAFNIISQGNVTDIVNSRSLDRRSIFESAAGVLKYKGRKEESLKKLEKTKDNLQSISIVIDELAKEVDPLKKQSEEAHKYLKLKEELENIDIALIVEDITKINGEYSLLEKEINSLKNKLNQTKNNELDAHLERLRLNSLELEEQINKKHDNLRDIEAKIYEYESEKRITLERQKYEVNKEHINTNLLNLKEEELNIQKQIDLLTKEVSDIENNFKETQEKLEQTKDKLLVLKVKRSTALNHLQEKEKEILLTKNKIDILENNILNADMAPKAVRSILGNPRLKGLHTTIGKLINLKEEYLIALDVTLGNAANYIVCDNEDNAIEAIEYLKSQKLGRATFYPLNIIKGRNIEESILNDIKNIRGYLGVFSSLVEYDSLYKDVIERELGNVILVDNARTMNVIGKLINYKYRIVTLDGEILYAGGSLSGGSSKKNNLLNEKNEINKLKIDLEQMNIELKDLTSGLDDFDKTILDLEEQEKVLTKYMSLYNDELYHKNTNLSHLREEYKAKVNELKGIEDLLANKIDDKIVELLENINATSKQKEIINQDLQKLQSKKNDLNEEILNIEKEQKEANSSYRELTNELKEKEIKFGKLEVNLDNLLLTLNNDYNKTYENAIQNYSLDMEYDLAKNKVNSLKKELSLLGNVNLGSIDEYERINKRYEFLKNQREDLLSSSNELNDIIKQMDEIMISKFKETFTKIQKEFQRIFKIMFKGGEGYLSLTDENDLLNTGIDIVAIPPGKKINSPLSLSGGEKALTALVLLFSMLEVRPSPFVILDEAEAALDEVNVDMFGKYLNEEKNKSQFIVITHKKKMMEYADILYGITMQESGVSKVVSAKLENN